MGYSLRSQTTIKMWEDGRRDPSDIQLAKLAGVYHVPVEIFYNPQETCDERLDSWIRTSLARQNRNPPNAATG